ncbi:hypothetical protein [Paenibacillus daejeonensis]|uniref:hypothetical protein n=1 Tax=Paenibacillus daejeonensis TaxID=135193 RepID=UPI00036BCD67|nr:hypothetical protein [Paenibacillus daejeonensis]
MGKRKKRSGKSTRQTNIVGSDSSNTRFRAKQSASATVGQGGNAFAINSNELGVIRVRAGQQG